MKSKTINYYGIELYIEYNETDAEPEVGYAGEIEILKIYVQDTEISDLLTDEKITYIAQELW